MRKVLRIILGVVIFGVTLHAADLATRDCRLAPYIYDDCLWIALRTHLGLPASKFLRMAALECVGVMLALILYLTVRYVFPGRPARSPRVASGPVESHSDGTHSKAVE